MRINGVEGLILGVLRYYGDSQNPPKNMIIALNLIANYNNLFW